MLEINEHWSFYLYTLAIGISHSDPYAAFGATKRARSDLCPCTDFGESPAKENNQHHFSKDLSAIAAKLT